MPSGTDLRDAAIVADGLWKIYRASRHPIAAVAGTTLSVPAKAFAVIMGPSGSGKSTLLNLVGALDRPDAGDLRVLGRDPGAMSSAARAAFRLNHVGFVFQRFNLISHLTALENVMLPLSYGRPRAPGRERRRQAEEMLEGVGLSSRLHHRPDELSGGEQQRVGIARALIRQPGLLLADEPTGELDSLTGRQVVDLIADLHRSLEMTVLVVTHDPMIIESADLTLMMRDGRIVEAHGNAGFRENEDPQGLPDR